MAARKKSAKKAPAKKTKARPVARTPATPAKKKAAAPKKSAARKSASAAAVPRPAAKPIKPIPKPAPRTPPTPAPPPAPAGAVTAQEVLLTHVMGLRPRIHVGFKPSAFGDAKRALADSHYTTLEEAARAVAEKAIEISNDSSLKDPFSRR